MVVATKVVRDFSKEGQDDIFPVSLFQKGVCVDADVNYGDVVLDRKPSNLTENV